MPLKLWDIVCWEALVAALLEVVRELFIIGRIGFPLPLEYQRQQRQM